MMIVGLSDEEVDRISVSRRRADLDLAHAARFQSQFGTARQSWEMTLRERDAGARLQASLQGSGALLVTELDHDVQCPRSPGRSMGAAARVVSINSRCDVRRDARIVASRRTEASENVDETSGGRHAASNGKFAAARNAHESRGSRAEWNRK